MRRYTRCCRCLPTRRVTHVWNGGQPSLERLFAAYGIEAVWRIDADGTPRWQSAFRLSRTASPSRGSGAFRGNSWPDMQPQAKPGEFLLGRDYINQYGGNFIGGLPPQLADNATYGAFRVLEQDVAAFEQFLVMAGQRYNMSPELVAAKLMGRWRNGLPLTLSPDTPAPARGIEPHSDQQLRFRPERRASDVLRRQDRPPLPGRVRTFAASIRAARSSWVCRTHAESSAAACPTDPPTIRPRPTTHRRARGLVGLLHLRRSRHAVRVSSIDLGERRLCDHRHPRHARTVARRSARLRRPVRASHERCARPDCLRQPAPVRADRGSVYCFIPAVGGLRFLAGT